MPTPFELVFVKSLSARSKASLMQTTDLLAQGLTNPILRLVQKYTRQFPCSPLMLGKRKRHQSFCQNHTAIYHFPKSLKTDGISPQVQIITMMSSTVDYRGKARRLEQKPSQRLVSSATSIMLCGWTRWTKFWNKQWRNHHGRPVLTFRHAGKKDEKLASKKARTGWTLCYAATKHKLTSPKADRRLFVGGAKDDTLSKPRRHHASVFYAC